MPFEEVIIMEFNLHEESNVTACASGWTAAGVAAGIGLAILACD